MKDIQEAVKDLRGQLGYPDWLSAIGQGLKEGRPAIILYLTGTWKPKLPFLEDGWEGYPVVFREHAAFAPLGGWRE
jgi:hypothetical protein